MKGQKYNSKDFHMLLYFYPFVVVYYQCQSYRYRNDSVMDHSKLFLYIVYEIMQCRYLIDLVSRF